MPKVTKQASKPAIQKAFPSKAMPVRAVAPAMPTKQPMPMRQPAMRPMMPSPLAMPPAQDVYGKKR